MIEAKARPAVAANQQQSTQPSEDGAPIDLSRPGVHALKTWGGAMQVRAVASRGVSAETLQRCELRPRRGGERFQATPRGTPRSLKKQFQARGVAAWDRDGPLVYAHGRLLYVPGLGIDARWLTQSDGPGLQLEWRPDPSVVLHRSS